VPGLVLLIDSHTCRVEASMAAWYTSLLQADLAGDPQQRADGTLATLGGGEFFSMLNSQVGGPRGGGEGVSTSDAVSSSGSSSRRVFLADRRRWAVYDTTP
jgi:hypothetical protein